MGKKNLSMADSVKILNKTNNLKTLKKLEKISKIVTDNLLF